MEDPAGRRLVVVPTLASTDAPTSALSAIDVLLRQPHPVTTVGPVDAAGPRRGWPSRLPGQHRIAAEVGDR